MYKTKLLANRLREVILKGKWIANTNYKDQISKLDWKQATLRIDNLNTIAALTFHINYYIEGVLNVFKGGSLEIKDKFSFDMPPITSKEDWEELQNSFWSNTEELALRIEEMPNSKLNEVFVDEKYGSYNRNINALIEHGYYHLGQISLIKKLIIQKT